jgi:ATP-dependent Lhr-like helicase
MALIRAVRQGRMDTTIIPESPLDVLAQQIVAEVAAEEWDVDELYALITRAYSYRNLSREDYERVLGYLGEGISQASGRGRTYLHHDHVRKKLRARKGARIAATTGGGAIPEIASYRVVAEPENTVVGSLDEEFAVESNAGDVFLLGNTSWRVRHVRGGDVTVYDAQGAPPTIPFWQGEGPGRTFELSEEIARLREELEARVEHPADAEAWLIQETSCAPFAASQAVTYAMAQKSAVGLLPTQKRVIYERFFDETGGMQLVVHAPFGAGINRAWGFAMRKRFCRSFDFELQATADDDGFILSLGPQHSFPIESLFAMLTEANAQSLLEQALLVSPAFQIRWRWNVTRSLLVMRSSQGKKVPPALQRFRADDLLTAVFPRLTGCQEEHTGDIEIPDHPLVRQTMHDCLNEYVNLAGLKSVLAQIERGEIQQIARDTREPSPFSYELLNSNPYAFLDGGEAQERRARAVQSRRSLSVESVEDLGRLDPEAIARVVAEAQPAIRDADELHDVLLSRLVLPESQDREHKAWFTELVGEGRTTTFVLPDHRIAWVSAERWPAACAVFPGIISHPPIAVPKTVRQEWSSIDARLAMVRGFLEVSGPATASQVANEFALLESEVEATLQALEGEGTVLRGRFSPHLANEPSPPVEWCHRRILARIHRETVAGLRREIEPVGVDVFIRFLARHHGIAKDHRRSGPSGLFEVVGQLQGCDIPAVAWERDILPLRVDAYRPEWLDELCLTGEVTWGRLYPPKKNPHKSRPMSAMTRSIPVGVLLREDASWLGAIRHALPEEPLTSPAQYVLEVLTERGAMFAADLAQATEMLPAQLPDVLGELVARGRITADGFSGLRQLIAGAAIVSRRPSRRQIVRERQSQSVGRWSLWNFAPAIGNDTSPGEIAEQWAWQLLQRWGVVFRDLLLREAGAPRWFELLQIYRKLEARGEIRGGRFISGVSGEQFALGETVRQLRQLRDQEPIEEYLVLSAADPLNLAGVLTSHPRVPALASHRVLYRNGVPLAWRRSQFVEMFDQNAEPSPLIQSLLQGRLGLHMPATAKPMGLPQAATEPKRKRSQPGRLF